MGIEAKRRSSSRSAPAILQGQFARAQTVVQRWQLGCLNRESARTARFQSHWNRPRSGRLRLPNECGMYLAVMSCREALHLRVGLSNEEAA